MILSPDTVLRAPLESLSGPRQINEATPQTLAQAESDCILKAIKEADWVLGGPKGAAKRLGLKRTTLIGKMRKPGLFRSMEAAAWSSRPCLE